ncbi:MAG: hypothetical protein B9S33_17355 [Pedosphaera sp. Tous-C6FEB]|nr:MAG: hypothetical protein B9S33_17355 [Pedosphaera sp. Tous-C6FEB]
MTGSPTKLIALGACLIVVAGLVAAVLAKRHEKKLTLASALATAAVQAQVAKTTGISGLARGIRIPFYEGEAKQPTSIMLGQTATPVDGGKYLVTEMRVENYTFGPTGRTVDFVIDAPQCLIDPATKVASSAGRIVVSRLDGSFMTTGIGFEFRQSESFLIMSNEVATHFTSQGFALPKPPTP